MQSRLVSSLSNGRTDGLLGSRSTTPDAAGRESLPSAAPYALGQFAVLSRLLNPKETDAARSLAPHLLYRVGAGSRIMQNRQPSLEAGGRLTYLARLGTIWAPARPGVPGKCKEFALPSRLFAGAGAGRCRGPMWPN